MNDLETKRNLRKAIFSLIDETAENRTAISISELSAFVVVSIAVIKLNTKDYDGASIGSFKEFHGSRRSELNQLAERYPNLVSGFFKKGETFQSDVLSRFLNDLHFTILQARSNADDVMSWSYQYIKRAAEKSEFRKIGRNKTKISTQGLLYTTQFFTDRYMVDFLVQRSMHDLSDGRINECVVIDPACGAGNFLTAGFDHIFRRAQAANSKASPEQLVDYILTNSILGYDLDHYLAEIASLALFVKASEYATPSKSTPIRVYGGQQGDIFGFLRSPVLSQPLGQSNFASALDEISRLGKTKVFLSNPPFMGKRDMDVSLKNYLLQEFPNAKADLCVAFIAKLETLLGSEDRLALVAQKSWMFLSSFSQFRESMIENLQLAECIDLGSNAFDDINGEKTNVALYVFRRPTSEKSVFLDLSHMSLAGKRSKLSRNNIPTAGRISLYQSIFKKNPGNEFNYQLSGRLKWLNALAKYSEFGVPMQGTSTGNNAIFVRYFWEAPESNSWKLVSKGGGYSKWAGLNYYKVFWGDNAEHIRNYEGSAVRNLDKMNETQLVFSDTGTLGLNVRVLRNKQVFIASGPGIRVVHGNMYAHLAFLNSRITTYLLKIANPKFSVSAGYIGQLPVAREALENENLKKLGRECVQLKEDYLSTKLPNIEFEHPQYGEISALEPYLEKQIIYDLENEFQRIVREHSIERELMHLYKLSAKEIQRMSALIGTSADAIKEQGPLPDVSVVDYQLASNLNINCMPKSTRLANSVVGSEKSLEVVATSLGCNPTILLSLIRSNVKDMKLTKAKYADDFTHKLMLFKLGYNVIDKPNKKKRSLRRLVRSVIDEVEFVNGEASGLDEIRQLLQTHHTASFYNRPLVEVLNDTVRPARNDSA